MNEEFIYEGRLHVCADPEDFAFAVELCRDSESVVCFELGEWHWAGDQRIKATGPQFLEFLRIWSGILRLNTVRGARGRHISWSHHDPRTGVHSRHTERLLKRVTRGRPPYGVTLYSESPTEIARQALADAVKHVKSRVLLPDRLWEWRVSNDGSAVEPVEVIVRTERTHHGGQTL